MNKYLNVNLPLWTYVRNIHTRLEVGDLWGGRGGVNWNLRGYVNNLPIKCSDDKNDPYSQIMPFLY